MHLPQVHNSLTSPARAHVSPAGWAGEAQYLERALNRYAPEVAGIAHAPMKKLRTRAARHVILKLTL
jgi:hypothetical protein